MTNEDLTAEKPIEVEVESEVVIISNDDIGLWPEHVVQQIDYWAKMGSSKLQHCDEELLKKQSFQQKGDYTRRCHTSMFQRRGRNGDIIRRSWLCFSPANGRVYCFVCKLFSTVRTQFTYGGFCDWKHANTRLMDHETSKEHLNAVVNFARRSKEVGRIDHELVQQAENTINYWRNVLKRLVSVIKYLAERGLAFRGDNELLGSPKNGNYLGLLELVAEYDGFLKEHIQNRANCGSGRTNYLSSTICEEVVQLMGKRVFDEIISRIKKSRYYSISLDSTPDEGHVDQLTLICRFIERDIPVERFLTYIPNQGHKAQEMFDGLMNFLQKHDIDIKNCRGQSYDNASAMSGKYNGLQSKVVAENDLASWIPCAAHSLNLVAKAAAECCTAAIDFFDFLEKIYVFFTVSTYRYNLLMECLKSCQSSNRVIVPKRVDTTRWSCRVDASKALVRGYEQFKDALAKISDDTEQLNKIRCEASGLYNHMCMLETAIYAIFWYEILDRVNATNQQLQDPKLDLNTAVAAMKSLKHFIETKRESFSEYERQGIDKSKTTQYVVHRKRQRNVRLNPIDYDQAQETELTPSQKFHVESFLPVIDQFLVSLGQRLSAYELVYSRFGFLGQLEHLSSNEISDQGIKLANTYKEDLDECTGIEFIQFTQFFKEFIAERKEVSKELFMYQLLIEKEVKDAFPNVEIALRMYLVLMVTNCSSERSFSKLKVIKNRLRTSMTEERLNYLALMSLERDILREVAFNDVIEDFAQHKARKIQLSCI